MTKPIQVPFRERKPAVDYCNRLLAKGYEAKVIEKKNDNGSLIFEVYAVPTVYMKRVFGKR